MQTQIEKEKVREEEGGRMRDREDGDRQVKQIANEKNKSDNAADVGREKEHKSELEVRECQTQENCVGARM